MQAVFSYAIDMNHCRQYSFAPQDKGSIYLHHIKGELNNNLQLAAFICTANKGLTEWHAKN